MQTMSGLASVGSGLYSGGKAISQAVAGNPWGAVTNGMDAAWGLSAGVKDMAMGGLRSAAGLILPGAGYLGYKAYQALKGKKNESMKRSRPRGQ